MHTTLKHFTLLLLLPCQMHAVRSNIGMVSRMAQRRSVRKLHRSKLDNPAEGVPFNANVPAVDAPLAEKVTEDVTDVSDTRDVTEDDPAGKVPPGNAPVAEQVTEDVTDVSDTQDVTEDTPAENAPAENAPAEDVTETEQGIGWETPVSELDTEPVITPNLTQCLIWSICTGLCTTLGVNLLQYTSHLERTGQHKFSSFARSVFYFINIVIMLIGYVTFLRATKYGAVSIAMPVLTASALLGNMLAQTLLGLQQYNKSMRVGTWVLICAVTSLIDVGPTDYCILNPGECDAKRLLATKEGYLTVVVNMSLLAFGIVSSFMLKNADRQSSYKIGAYGLVVASATAVGVSSAKLWQMHLPYEAACCCLGLYLLCGIISFGGAAVAATDCDASVYLPVRCSLQLLVNAFTGMFLWQDWRVIDDYVAYVAVYILVILGAYLVSTYDLFPHALHTIGTIAALQPAQPSTSNTNKIQGVTEMPFNKAVDECVGAWNESGNSDKQAAASISDMLKHGLESGDVDAQSLLNLTQLLLEKNEEASRSDYVKAWMQTNVQELEKYYVLVNGKWCSRESAESDVGLPVKNSSTATVGSEGKKMPHWGIDIGRDRIPS